MRRLPPRVFTPRATLRHAEAVEQEARKGEGGLKLDHYLLVSELAFGRYVVHAPWSRIASDYNLLRGGLLPIGLLVVTAAPLIAASSGTSGDATTVSPHRAAGQRVSQRVFGRELHKLRQRPTIKRLPFHPARPRRLLVFRAEDGGHGSFEIRDTGDMTLQHRAPA
jgi:hypothetical protein